MSSNTMSLLENIIFHDNSDTQYKTKIKVGKNNCWLACLSLSTTLIIKTFNFVFYFFFILFYYFFSTSGTTG